MKHLYAPWRDRYTIHSAHKDNEDVSSEDCTFCTQIAAQDDENYFIIKRYAYHVVMLNLYPYNAGHVLVVPYKHVADLADLAPQESAELMDIVTTCTQALKLVLKADGINVGINLGKMAGAGMPSHLHAHVLPRFLGDTNFMPTLNNTKVISFDLSSIYQQLKAYFEKP
jgi:ATP adenylyltransferase